MQVAALTSSKADTTEHRPKVRTQTGVMRMLLFFGCIALVAYAIHGTISSGLRRISTSKFGVINKWMGGNADSEVIINGSSRALVHYDPRIIVAETGLTAYNIGMNGIQIDVQAGILDAYLARNKAPKIILQNLEAFSFECTKPGEIYDPGIYIPYLSSSDELYKALHGIDPQVWKWRNIPLYGYVVPDLRFTWALGVLRWLGVQGGQDYFDGFNPRHAQWTQDFDSFRQSMPHGVTYRIEPKGLAALEHCIQSAQSRGATIILVFAPEFHEMQMLERNREEIFGHFRDLAKKYRVEFWDFSDSPLCRDQTFFYNSQHLNAMGAALFSQEVGRRLRSFLERHATSGGSGGAPSVANGDR